MINKLNQLARKKYILFGIPLLCGAIIGTTITMNIPHVKANATIQTQGSTSNQTIDTSNAVSVPNMIHTHIDPPTSAPAQSSPTTAPTSTPVQSTSTTSQPAPTVVPCK